MRSGLLGPLVPLKPMIQVRRLAVRLGEHVRSHDGQAATHPAASAALAGAYLRR